LSLPLGMSAFAGIFIRNLLMLFPDRSPIAMNISMFDKFIRLLRPRLTPQRLLSAFQQERAALEEQFFQKARTAGIPRGLRWVRCDWLPEKTLLQDKTNGQICLLVSVNISFEAIEGGDMEDVAAVSLIRDACAVFQMTASGWQASGRTLFNMNPAEAMQKLGGSYSPYPAG
jgi:hypothetical protein